MSYGYAPRSLNAQRIEETGNIVRLACEEGRLDEAKRLLHEAQDDRAAVVEWLNRRESPLLLQAAGEGRLSLVRFLVSAGANVNQQGPNGSALHNAAEWGRLEVMQHLLEHGADINAKDAETRRTALMVALCARQTRAARYLLDQGAACDESLIVEDAALWRTADFAAAFGNAEVFIEIYERGAMAGCTTLPLARALRHGAPSVVVACLDHPEIRLPAEGRILNPALVKACWKEEVRQILLSWHSEYLISRAIDSEFIGESVAQRTQRRSSTPTL